MAKLFQKSDLQPDVMLTDAGLRPERPFQILGLLETLAFGDLILNVVFLSTLANQFDHVRLHVRYRDVRPYAKDIMTLSPWIDVAESVSEEPNWLRSVMLAIASKQPSYMRIGTQKGKHVPLYDMVVTSHMAQRELVHALPDPIALRFPPAQEDELRARLLACGLKPDRWFAVIHYRESTYKYRNEGSDRDSDPKAFDSLVDGIIALGGQAVRIGHIGMTPFRSRDGFVDLSAESFLVQAAAVSLSRFMIAGPSGAIALALAFQVPSTLVDAVDIFGMWGPIDVLTHVVKAPSCQMLRNAALRDAGLMDSNILAARMKAEPGFEVKKATACELRAVAHKLFARTNDCPTWRPPVRPVASKTSKKMNYVPWPLRRTDPMLWLDL